MKRILPLLFVISLLMMKCKPNVAEPFHFDLGNGKGAIVIGGSQENWAEPWSVVIKLVYNEEIIDQQIGVLYLSELNKEVVEVVWVNPSQCKLVFTERDGEKSEVYLKSIPTEE